MNSGAITADQMRERGNQRLVQDTLKEIDFAIVSTEPEERSVKLYFVTLGKPMFIHEVCKNLEGRGFNVESGPNSFDETYVEVSW